MKRILIVCTGNICRSPMAAALLQSHLREDEGRADWEVLSAGIWAPEGRPASGYAIDEMEKRDLDITGHRSRRVSEELARSADLILVMTKHHAEAIRQAFPRLADRVHLISETIDQEYDICDPYGGTRMEYAYVAQELEELVEAGYQRIVQWVEEANDNQE